MPDLTPASREFIPDGIGGQLELVTYKRRCEVYHLSAYGRPRSMGQTHGIDSRNSAIIFVAGLRRHLRRMAKDQLGTPATAGVW